MKSVVRASGRVVNCLSIVGLCAFFASACVEGDPVPSDVVYRAESVLLEGNLGAGVSPAASSAAPSSSASQGAPSDGVTPAASASGFPNIQNTQVLPGAEELEAQELGEDAVPEDAIPLLEFYQ